MADPLRANPLDYAVPVAVNNRWVGVARWGILGCWSCAVSAWGLVVFVDVETVLFSGPVLFMAAAITVAAALSARRMVWALIAGSYGAICLLLFGLVHIFRWGPSEAHAPFGLIGAAYVCIAAVPAAWVFRSNSAINVRR